MDHLEPIFVFQAPATMSAHSVLPESEPASQTAEYGCVDWFPYMSVLTDQAGRVEHQGSLALAK